MQAETYELRQILSPERRYIIPTFQRDYEWTADGQWELLFEDLESVVDHLDEARQFAASSGTPQNKAEKGVSPHFLGAVVCDQLPSPAGGLDVRAVIDGQQRLTTLQLLVRGVLDAMIEINSPRIPQLRRLIENPDYVVVEPHERHKLWPRRKDREVWPLAMADDCTLDGPHLYLQARRFFAQRTRQAIVSVDGRDRADCLVDALLGLFKLVVIDLEDNDDAQVIFEVLNGRQTPLSASDLVKNLLFLRGEMDDEALIEQLYDQYWAPFDEDWWKATVGTGHAARGRRDVLLSAWLTAASGQEANVGHLYGQVRDYLSGSDRKTTEVLAELHAYGEAYEAVYGSRTAASPYLAIAYRRLTRLNNTTSVPLLLWLLAQPVSRLPLADHELIVRAVESWVLRRMLIGGNTRGYGKAFLDVLKAAQAAGSNESIAQAVVQALEKPNGLSWPSDDDVRRAFRLNRFYGYISQERIRLVLGAIDQRLREDNPWTETATFDYDPLQIEHVMPQAWRDHWGLPMSDEAERVFAAQTRDAAVHRLGNLTLVTPQFNQGVSNSAWALKRPEFQAQSALRINKSVAGREVWDEAAIDARAAELADVAVRIWPSEGDLRTQIA